MGCSSQLYTAGTHPQDGILSTRICFGEVTFRHQFMINVDTQYLIVFDGKVNVMVTMWGSPEF